MLRPTEVARWLNFGIDYIRKLVEAESIPYIQLPGGRRNIRFSPSKIKAWLEQQSMTGVPRQEIGERDYDNINLIPRRTVDTDIVGHFRSKKVHENST